MTFFDKVRVYIFTHQIRVRSMFLETIGGTPAKRVPESLTLFGVFVDSIGGGTPGKRVHEVFF